MYCKNCKKISYRFRRKSLICILSQDDEILLSNLKDYCEPVNSKKSSCGECTILDEHFIGHYICDSKLYFRIDNTTCLFSDVTFNHSKKFFKRRVLDITLQNGESIRLRYKIKRVLDFFYEEDEDDMDYGFFLYNTEHKKEGSKIMIDAYMSHE